MQLWLIVECSPGSWDLFAGTVNIDRTSAVVQGYDPQFGARPLKRAIQEHLLDPLATKLLDGSFKPGDKIKVSEKDGELIFLRK